MILTTTPTVETAHVKSILGLVTGEAVSLNTLNDLGASLQNLGGDTSPVSEKLLFQAKERAVRKMEERAKELGADAVVGVSFNGSATAAGMLVFVAGTAVKLA